MPASSSSVPLDSFSTFGALLKYLRRRARLTQREVAIAVGYSEAQISRLEQNQRPPDLAALTALFIPALYVDAEPEVVARLLELAAEARGEHLPHQGVITFSRSIREEIREDVRSMEEYVRNNLPLQLTSFVGRQREIAEVKNLLEKAKLITLTGSGGCGKTRLALEAAGQLGKSFRDGIWLVELASLFDSNLVLPAVISTLGIPGSQDSDPIRVLTRYLSTKQILLIFDNCEQIVRAVAQLVEDILRTCSHVKILTTSREILNITGEVQFRVPSLSLSNENSLSGTAFSPSEAVQLFVERAQAVLPSFLLTDQKAPVVTQICQLVDGMPLGIELAAAKVTVLSVEQIAARLHDSFQLLGGGRVTFTHHQTLETTLQWSYDLLPEEERVLLQRLSVFSGGWTLEAAEAVTSDRRFIPRLRVLDLLSQLINKSLVVLQLPVRNEARYTMLQTIHDFARRKLHETEETAQMRAHHFDYFFSMTQAAHLFGEDKGRWLDRLEAEHDNLRSALAWSLETGQVEKGTELILPILDFYWFRGYSLEAREWLDKFLEMESPLSRTRAFVLQKAGWLTRASGDFQKADILLRRALEMAYEIGDTDRAAWALMDLGLSVREQGNNEKAISYFWEALKLVQESGNKQGIGNCMYYLAQSYAHDLDRSNSLWEQGLTIHRTNGDQVDIARGLEGLAGVAYLKKDFASALQFHLESFKLKVGVMDKLGIAYSFEGLAQVAAAQDEPERAGVLWGAANHLREAMNVPIESSRENMYTSLIPATRNQLGDEEFDRAWDKGRDMTLQEAIRYALSAEGKTENHDRIAPIADS